MCKFDCFQAYSKVKQVQRLFLHALDKSLSAPALCPGSLPRAGVDARKKYIVASHNDSDLAFLRLVGSFAQEQTHQRYCLQCLLLQVSPRAPLLPLPSPHRPLTPSHSLQAPHLELFTASTSLSSLHSPSSRRAPHCIAPLTSSRASSTSGLPSSSSTGSRIVPLSPRRRHGGRRPN